MTALRHGGRRSKTANEPRVGARSSGRLLDAGASPSGVVPRSTAVAWLGPRVDASTAYVCFARCVSRRAPHVIADLSSTTFMDQAGYRALMQAGAAIELRGDTFSVRGAAGQPSRLLRRLAP
jgi:anti-anti-sigma regulatory factor